jgi:hypothetical protein
MIVIDGFFENGLFIPNTPVMCLKGRQEAKLLIKGHRMVKGRWKKIKKKEEMLSNPETFEAELEMLR